jgi:hypothetical protein
MNSLNEVDAGREKGRQTAKMSEIGDRGAAREQHSRVLRYPQHVHNCHSTLARCKTKSTAPPTSRSSATSGLRSSSGGWALPLRSIYDLQEGKADRVFLCFQ